MKTLVWVEHDGSAVKDATLAAVTAASKLGEVHLLVAGEGVDGVAKEAAQIAGVAFDKVAIFFEQTVERMIAQDLDQRVDRRVGGLCAQMAVAQDDGGHGRSPWD